MNLNTRHNQKFRKELNGGLIALMLLAMLAETEEPQYGYQLAKRLEQVRPLTQLPALYAVLRSLERSKLLTMRLGTVSKGPARKLYTITEEGRRALRSWSAIWRHTACTVNTVLGCGSSDLDPCCLDSRRTCA